MKTFKLSDSAIAQIVKLIQLGILTGTDISDQLRMFELCESDTGTLVPSPDFLETLDGNIKRLSDAASETEEQPTD